VRLVYICGPYSASTPLEVERNIERARERARDVWRAGHLPVCPHLLTAGIDDSIEDNPQARRRLLRHLLRLLGKCDEVWLVEGWSASEGSRMEVDFARFASIPIYSPDGMPLDDAEAVA
jgi:hypothetical protein